MIWNSDLYLEAANITRVKDDMTFSQIVINLEKAIINDSLNNIYLQSNDEDYKETHYNIVTSPHSYEFQIMYE